MNVSTSKFQEDLKQLLFLEAKKIIITKEIIDNQSNSNQSDYIEDIQQRIKILQNEIVNLSTELNLNNKTQVEKCNEANLDSEIVFDTELNEILDQCHKDIKQHTNHHKDSLNSKTSPLYTLPNAFKYEIKMRDTKMKGMSMYENPNTSEKLSDLNISNSSSSALSPKSQQSIPSKNNSPVAKRSTAPTLAPQGSKERENELQYFFDTSPTLAHSIHDLTQAIEECTKDGLDDHGLASNESSLCKNDDDEHSYTVDGIEFCIVEADWLRLQTTSSVASSASLASSINSTSMSDQLVSIAANRSSALLTPLLPPHRSWRYPHDLEDNSLVNNTKELQDQSFFFPSGVKVELVACAVAELRSKTSQHIRHVVPFTDGQGKPTYACVLTISQIYESSEISIQGDNIVPNLVKINKQKQAATCIQKCFRQFLAYRKVQNWQMRRPGHSGPNSPANTINNSVSGDMNNNPGSAPPSSFRSSLFRTHSSRMSDTSVHGGVGGTNSSSGVNTPAKYSDSNNSNPSNTNRQNSNNTRRTFLSYFSRNTANSSAISQSSAIPSENNEVINNNTAEDSMNTNNVDNENRTSTATTTTISSSDHCKSDPSTQPIVDGDSRTSLNEGKEMLVDSPIMINTSSSSKKHRFSLDKDSIAQYISKKAIVAQKAYCIISTSQQYTFIFKVLDAIAAAEAANKVSSLVDINNRSDQRNRFLELVETFLITNLVNRKITSNPLHQLSRSLITRSMKKYPLRGSNTITNIYNPTTYNNQQVKVVNKKLQQHIRVPGYISDFKINLDRLLSTQEWTCAVLFTHLNSQIIFKIINLLLMEKSLIIHGRNAGIVTTITMAVINLISPFAWEGIFVPLVPDNARELFGAPVPLIVGTTSPPRINDVSADTAILFLNDDNVIISTVSSNNTNNNSTGVEEYDATLQSTSSSDNNYNEEVNEVKMEMKFVAWFVRLPEVSADMPFELEICRRIDYTSMLLCNHCFDKIEFKYQELEGRNSIKASKGGGGSPRPSEHKRVGSITTMSSKNKSPFTSNCRIANTIDSLLMSEVPLKILEQVRILISSIQRYNYGFCGCVLEEPGTWKKFLKRSTRTGTDEFYPEYFMEPLRNHLEFQDAIVHTQLFVSFMDKLHKEHIEMDHYRYLLILLFLML